MKNKRSHERGAVSLFVVIFSALLITTITVAFVHLMVQNQQQATANDLSRSALDSAFAGVEDAKRAIVTYQEHCVGTGDGVGSTECNNLTRALQNGQQCDTLQQAGIAGNPGDKEVLIKQTEGDEILQQAYTCVKVQLDTNDYIGSLTPNTSRLIPLKSNGAFDHVDIEWYSQSDLQNSQQSTIDLTTDSKLPKLAQWKPNRPALLRVQLIQYGDSFNLSDFTKDDNGTSDNATLFLLPSEVGLNNYNFGDDARQSQTKDVLKLVKCDSTFTANSSNGQYACKASLQLPLPIGASGTDTRHAYIRVSEVYNPNTSFRVSLWDSSSNVVQFNGVQPIVDSTGRANDLFRRVRSRIEANSSAIPPAEATIDITGSLCKSFLVTDKADDYSPGSCQDGATTP
jgi:hypothetical protein